MRLNWLFPFVYVYVSLKLLRPALPRVSRVHGIAFGARTLFSLGLIASFHALAAPTYLGLYMQNQKIGYASYSSRHVLHSGRSLDQSDTHTVMDAGLLGTPLKIEIDSTSYLDAKGAPVEMTFTMRSNGRSQKVDATFGESEVLVEVNNSGAMRTLHLKKPPGLVVDDPMNLLLTHQRTSECYILDPTTVSFERNEVKVIGTKKVMVRGKSVTETIVDVIDPRATTRAYLDEKQNLIRAEGVMGIVMVPETAAEAMVAPAKYSKGVDLGYSTSIVPKGHLDDPASTTEIRLRISGHDLRSTPSDETQTVTGGENVWTLDIHPQRFAGGVSITAAAAEKPEYTKEDLDIPSDSPAFRKLAKEIVGSRKDTLEAALAIKDWVYGQMRPNAGIAVLRDATEVLRTKEGVCRDYAILTATLLRSAGIPTRLASGLVTWDGTFYYHAWDEVWNGQHWIGIDSTTPDKQLSAAHIKLAEGSVAQAFNFAVLDHVSIEILSQK